MMDGDIERALAPYLCRSRVTSVLQSLVQAPSPLTDLQEDEPQLRAFIQEAVAPRLASPALAPLGFQPPRYDTMGNLVAVAGPAGGRSMMLVTHAMNQPPASMPDPYGGQIVDGTPYGLPGQAVRGKGASEQKGTLAAMLHAMEAVAASGLKLAGRLVFVCCVSGESGKHDAIRSVVETLGARADIAFVYGNGLAAQIGNRGRIDLTAVVTGQPSHSSRPRMGANAVTGAMELLRRLATELPPPRMDPELGEASLTCNGIHSLPRSSHTIQDRCTLSLDQRLLPGDTPQDAVARITAVLAGFDAWPDPVSGLPLYATLHQGPMMYPSLRSRDAPVVRLLEDGCGAMLGSPPAIACGGSAHDQGYLNHMGIQTINFGAGEEHLAHTDNDMASIDRCFDAARVYAWMIARYLGGPHPA